MYRKIGTIAVNDITRNVKHLSCVYIDVYVVAQKQHGTYNVCCYFYFATVFDVNEIFHVRFTFRLPYSGVIPVAGTHKAFRFWKSEIPILYLKPVFVAYDDFQLVCSGRGLQRDTIVMHFRSVVILFQQYVISVPFVRYGYIIVQNIVSV